MSWKYLLQIPTLLRACTLHDVYTVTIAIQLLFEYVIGNSKLYVFTASQTASTRFSWRRSEAKFLLIKSKIFCKQKSGIRAFTYNKIHIIQPPHIIITHHFISRECACAYAFSRNFTSTRTFSLEKIQISRKNPCYSVCENRISVRCSFFLYCFVLLSAETGWKAHAELVTFIRNDCVAM